MINGN